MNAKEWYQITLTGCDMWTDIDIELTQQELALLQVVAERSVETSTVSCMPKMSIKPTTAEAVAKRKAASEVNDD